MCQLVKHEDGDDEQGDAGHEPAEDVGPQRVDVALAEFQRGVLDNGEDEGALARRSTRDRQVSELCLSGLLSLLLGKEDPSHIELHVSPHIFTHLLTSHLKSSQMWQL